MRIYRWVAGAIALLFVFGPAIMYVAGERPVAFENRPLADAPDLADGWDALDALAPWASDHLPGRQRAVRANAWLDYHVLGTLPSAAGSGGTPPAAAGATNASPSTPTVIRGKDDVLFLGEQFDLACTDRRAFRPALRQLAKVAHVIKNSGRKVAFYVSPNKSSVDSAHLPRFLPTGRCAEKAIEAQNRTLDTLKDSLYIPIRSDLATLARAGKQPYWKTDTHWSSVGSALLAERLAQQLNPAAAARLETAAGTSTKVGDLALLAGLDLKEEAPSVDVTFGGTVDEGPASDHFVESEPVYGTHRWTTTPATGLVQGDTALVGDSFTYFALGNLRPLFAEGEFFWVGQPATTEDIVDGILASDNVVISVAQRNVARNLLITEYFYVSLVRALLAEAH